MSEYVIEIPDEYFANYGADRDMYYPDERDSAMPIMSLVRCRDCKHLDDSEASHWDSVLAEQYGEPPLFCNLLSINEWRMDGNRRVAETSFLEVEPDGFCAWGERRES